MIISHKYKFIFIKTAKTAGTSIEAYLSDLCGNDDVFTPIYPPSPNLKPRNFGGPPLPDLGTLRPGQFAELNRQHKFRNHMGASEIKRLVDPQVWGTYLKFCVERNPWDKVVSSFYMQVHRNAEPKTFAQFINSKQFPVDWPRWYDKTEERYLVDKVLRFENLNAELGGVFNSLGVPFAGNLDSREKACYRPKNRPYRQHYREPGQIKSVLEAFETEIRLLSYKF